MQRSVYIAVQRSICSALQLSVLIVMHRCVCLVVQHSVCSASHLSVLCATQYSVLAYTLLKKQVCFSTFCCCCFKYVLFGFVFLARGIIEQKRRLDYHGLVYERET